MSPDGRGRLEQGAVDPQTDCRTRLDLNCAGCRPVTGTTEGHETAHTSLSRPKFSNFF